MASFPRQVQVATLNPLLRRSTKVNLYLLSGAQRIKKKGRAAQCLTDSSELSAQCRKNFKEHSWVFTKNQWVLIWRPSRGGWQRSPQGYQAGLRRLLAHQSLKKLGGRHLQLRLGYGIRVMFDNAQVQTVDMSDRW